MSVLEAALRYQRRGWSIIAIKPGTKEPVVRWKLFQDLRPSQGDLRKWFGNGRDLGVAVVSGAVSGQLVVRDFDDLDAYQEWSGAHAELAAALPTVATGRGRHVYFRSRNVGFRDLADGEYRGKGHYTLLPPSMHPNGTAYRWEMPLPEGELPWVEDPVADGLLPAEPEPPPPLRKGRPDRPGRDWPPSGLTQRTRRFLSIGAGEGNRNEELFCAACDMASRGIGHAEAQKRLLAACRGCQPPYPVQEAVGTIASAFSVPRWQAATADDPWGAYSIPRCMARRRDLNATDKLIWASLDYRQREKADCWPKLATIGKDAGCCRATAAKSVNRLEKAGLLEVRRKYGEVSHYTTYLPKGANGGPVQKADSNTIALGRELKTPPHRRSQ